MPSRRGGVVRESGQRLPSYTSRNEKCALSMALAGPIIEHMIEHLDANHHKLAVTRGMGLTGRAKRFEQFGGMDFVAQARPQFHYVAGEDFALPVAYLGC